MTALTFTESEALRLRLKQHGCPRRLTHQRVRTIGDLIASIRLERHQAYRRAMQDGTI